MGNQQSRNGLQFCTSTEALATRFMVDKDFRIKYYPSQTKNTDFSKLSLQQRIKLCYKIDEFCSANEEKGYEESVIPVGHQNRMRDFNRQQQTQEELMGNPLKMHEFKIEKSIETHVDLEVKTEQERDACFAIMNGNLSSSLSTQLAPSETSSFPDETVCLKKYIDGNNNKIFNGISGKIFVRDDNQIVYSDYDGKKHCATYSKNNIEKCFPYGICFGGLIKTIWLTDEMERDMCFNQMLRIEKVGLDKEKKKTFKGLYGSVVIAADHEIIFTSLIGERITCLWDDEIRLVFPLGISGGGLARTIWFKEVDAMEDCFSAMKEKSKNRRPCK